MKADPKAGGGANLHPAIPAAVLYVLAQAADVATSLYGELSGKTVEANHLLQGQVGLVVWKVWATYVVIELVLLSRRWISPNLRAAILVFAAGLVFGGVLVNLRAILG